MSEAIELVDVVKVYKGQRALDELSFAVPRGQVCALLGPNGAGKTTTIQILLGLTEPDSGTVRVLGHDIGRRRVAALRRTNFMASYGHFPWRMTVREVLRVYAELYEVRNVRQAMLDAADVVGIGHLLGRLSQTLSSGEQTLVAVAKSLLNAPELLFLDEPTASLDPEHAVHVRTVLQDVASRLQMTMLVTSHNMREVEQLADRVLFLSRGRLLADDTPTRLRERFGVGDLEAAFLAVAREGRLLRTTSRAKRTRRI